MKAKYLGILLVMLTFIGCDDNTGSLGLGMLPDSDKLSVEKETFKVHTRSFLADSVFSKTNIGYVGKYTDPLFGFYDASFLTQFNCTENLSFPTLYSESNKKGDMAGDSLGVYLTLYYTEYFGDSLNPSRMSIYELNQTLDKHFYTTIEPEKYYDEKDLLARKAYTAVDLSLSDSIRNADGNYVRFTLPEEFGKRIRDLNWKHPEYFKDADTFIENVFKGIYVKNDFGDGTILYVDEVELTIRYNCHYKDSVTGDILKNVQGTDSIYGSNRIFSATKEVIQANRFTNSELLKQRVEETQHTYIKSPAGIFTQATLPIDEIYEELHSDTLNAVKLVFTGYQSEKNEIDDNFKMKTPKRVLLIREKEMKSFFENNSLNDNITSYLSPDMSGTTADVRSYTFDNITYLINTCIDEKEKVRKGEGKDWTDEEWKKWEEDTKWNSILLVPVIVNTDGQQGTSPLSIQNDMEPGYIKLQGGEKDILDLEIHYTVFH